MFVHEFYARIWNAQLERRVLQYVTQKNLKYNWNVFFIAEFERTAKIRKIAIYCLLISLLCISQFQASTSPRADPPGNFFKVVKFPAPTQKPLRNYGPGAKNRQKPRPWGQFCGPSRQFCNDRETIHIFLVLFFSLAWFEFFQRL